MNRRRLAQVLALPAFLLVTGCAVKTRTPDMGGMMQPSWHGRLTMQVHAHPDDPMSESRSFGAAFELTGSPDLGELSFFSPLGSTAAAIRWSPQSATLEAQGETRSFEGLTPLIQHLLGTNVPVPALFAWLSGRNLPADGWQVDLGEYAKGRVIAQRLAPLPYAQLRLVLEP